jgi:hypothetical protein
LKIENGKWKRNFMNFNTIKKILAQEKKLAFINGEDVFMILTYEEYLKLKEKESVANPMPSNNPSVFTSPSQAKDSLETSSSIEMIAQEESSAQEKNMPLTAENEQPADLTINDLPF